MTKLKVIDKEYGFMNYNGIPVVSSRTVRDVFGKRHDHVLRDIEKLIEKVKQSEERTGNFNPPKSGEIYFTKSTYIDSKNREYPEYLLTKDGFTLLVMGYTDEKAIDFKLEYIRRYNEMESYIKNLNKCRAGYPLLTSTLKLVKGNPKYFEYVNEANLLNTQVLGMTAKQFKEQNGLPKNTKSIRPSLSALELFIMDKAQTANVGLVIAYPHNFEMRKKLLGEYVGKVEGAIDKGKVSLLED